MVSKDTPITSHHHQTTQRPLSHTRPLGKMVESVSTQLKARGQRRGGAGGSAAGGHVTTAPGISLPLQDPHASAFSIETCLLRVPRAVPHPTPVPSSARARAGRTCYAHPLRCVHGVTVLRRRTCGCVAVTFLTCRCSSSTERSSANSVSLMLVLILFLVSFCRVSHSRNSMNGAYGVCHLNSVSRDLYVKISTL